MVTQNVAEDTPIVPEVEKPRKPVNWADMKLHPVTADYPMMDDGTYLAMKADVKRVGFRTPLVLTYEDDDWRLVDGKHRYAIWRDLIREGYHEIRDDQIPWEELPADITPKEYAESANFHRRHLTEAQILMTICQEMVEAEKAKGKKLNRNQRDEIHDQVAERFGIDGRDIPEARVKEFRFLVDLNAPHYIQLVFNEIVPVATAAKTAKPYEEHPELLDRVGQLVLKNNGLKLNNAINDTMKTMEQEVRDSAEFNESLGLDTTYITDPTVKRRAQAEKAAAQGKEIKVTYDRVELVDKEPTMEEDHDAPIPDNMNPEKWVDEIAKVKAGLTKWRNHQFITSENVTRAGKPLQELRVMVRENKIQSIVDPDWDTEPLINNYDIRVAINKLAALDREDKDGFDKVMREIRKHARPFHDQG